METRKQVEIVRALSCDPKILILDEVTQSLSHNNRHTLYKIIEHCKNAGIAVLIISHDLEELIQITDSITVLRDGAVVDTVISSEVDTSVLKQMMVGRELSGDYYRTDGQPNYSDEVVLSVKNLTTEDPAIEDVSFDLHKGEILACCGLSDGGTHELGKAVFGIMGHKHGSVTVMRTGAQITSAVDAVHNGIAYVPKDRDADGIMLGASIKENMVLPSIMNLKRKFGFLHEQEINQFVASAVDQFDVKCTGPAQIIVNLSGGNKQKINLGRWISKGAEIFVLDCPTRGVDVGVKAYIYHTLRQLKDQGVSILLISDELPEAIGMADRILIMSAGRVKEVVSRGKEFDESTIIEVMI